MWQTLKGAEWGAALFLTLLVVCLHLMAATSSGALWRDESNTIAIATLPRVTDVWKNLQYDSFPILWPLIVRLYASIVGPMNDPAFRALGLLIGLGVTGALWFNARTFGHSVPLLSLALFGMSPSMIRWGDTMRAYGFGILLSLLACAFLWRFIEKPSTSRFVVTAVVAIASVNVLYYNAVLLLAFCSGVAAVCVYRQRWKDTALIVLIGALAAISLLAYASTIRNAEAWNILVRIPNYDFHWFWTKLGQTIRPAGGSPMLVWVSLASAAAVYGTIAVITPHWLNTSENQREIALFALVTLLVGTAGSYVFLRALSYYTQPWYYLTLLAVTAVSVDALFGAVIRMRAVRASRLAASLLVAAATILPASRLVRQRLTNIDIVVAKLESIAKPGDVVLVTPWQYGVTFSRYYRGANNWMTVPPVAWHRFHRYDQLADLMRIPDQNLPAQQIEDRASYALRSGHRVFVLGALLARHGSSTHMPSSSEGGRPNVWSESTHEQHWESLVHEFLDQHATKRAHVPVILKQIVGGYEFAWLRMYEGWNP